MPQTGEKQVPAVEISQWLGLMTNVGPLAIPPGGTQVQVNVTSVSPGTLETRGGTRDLSFEN